MCGFDSLSGCQMNKRIIQEWDGTTSVVQPYMLDSGDILIEYEDGHTHVVTKEYLDSITIRTYA